MSYLPLIVVLIPFLLWLWRIDAKMVGIEYSMRSLRSQILDRILENAKKDKE